MDIVRNHSGLILTTPVKNEEKNIEKTIEHVINQSLKPMYWIIINDHSTDNTANIIKKYTKKISWLILKNSPFKKKNEYTLGFHIAKLKSYGLDFGLKLSKKKGLIIKYLSILDGDNLIKPDYFETLINFLDTHPEYGIVSPFQETLDGKEIQVHPETISGGSMIMVYKCYKNLGGLVISSSFDSATYAKAVMLGWKTMKVKKSPVIVRRETASGDGLVKGYYNSGQSKWYLGVPLYIIFLKFIQYSFKMNPKIGLSFLNGYFSAKKILNNNIKVMEPLIYEYYHSRRPKDIIKELLVKP